MNTASWAPLDQNLRGLDADVKEFICNEGMERATRQINRTRKTSVSGGCYREDVDEMKNAGDESTDLPCETSGYEGVGLFGNEPLRWNIAARVVHPSLAHISSN